MSFPSNPTNQQTAVVNNTLFVFSAADRAWTRVVGQDFTIAGNIVAGGVRSTTSATAPATATIGDFWYNTTNDVLYRFTNTGVNTAWLDIESPSMGQAAFGNSAVTFGNVTIYGNLTLTSGLAISSGGTGATTVAAAQTNLQVDPAGTAVALSIALG